MNLFALIAQYWHPALEIGLISIFLYSVYYVMRETRGGAIFKGLGLVAILILLLVFLAARTFELNSILWLLEKMIAIGFIMLVIIFQPELRRVLFNIGENPLFQKYIPNQNPVIGELVRAVVNCSGKKVGLLIAIERTTALKAFIEGGTRLNSDISAPLISTIAYFGTPLHDGAMIIQQDRIAAAGCLFPLSQNPEIGKSLGTRHRAALGLTEESDAVVIVVSEETGKISVAVRGHLTQGLNRDSLRKILLDLVGDAPESGEGES